jgi:protocatechuate 3,4-dioxygenase beta subunit
MKQDISGAPGVRRVLLAFLCGGLAAVAARGAAPVHVKGRVTLDGRPPAGWSLRAVEERAEEEEKAWQQPLAADGTFSASLPDDGSSSYQVLLLDETGRPVIGWPHVGRDRDFQTVALRREATLTGAVRDAEGRPVAGCEVVLDLRLTAGCTHHVEAARARTAADGAFAFDGLVPGKYRCRLAAETQAAVPREVEVAEEFAFVEIQTVPAGVITGRVMSAGEPLAGARISVREGAGASVLSSPDGQYRLGGLSAGCWHLRVEAPGHVPKGGSEALSATISAGETLNRDIEMVPAAVLRLALAGDTPEVLVPANTRVALQSRDKRHRRFVFRQAVVSNGVIVIAGLEPGAWTVTLADDSLGSPSVNVVLESGRETRAAISLPVVHTVEGLVVDDSGAALSNADVRATLKPAATAATRRRLVYSGGDSRRRIDEETDGDGRFTLTGLTTGRWEIAFAHDEHLPASTEIAVPRPEGAQPLRQVLRRGGVFSGRLTDEGGKPLPDVMVSATFPAEGDDHDSRSATTDAEGRFRLAGLPTGKEIELRVNDDDHVPFRRTLTTLPADDPQRVLVLSNGLAIAGHVSLADGKPAAGAKVNVHGPKEKWEVYRSTEVGGDGTFVLRGLPEGHYQVSFHDEHETISSSDNVAAGTDDLLVQFAAKTPVAVVVTDADGLPLPGAVVQATRQAGGSMTFSRRYGGPDDDTPRSDEQGRLTLDLRLGAKYVLTASKPPLLPASRTIDLDAPPAADAPPVTLRLEKGATLRGTVVEADGRTPRANALVRVVPPDNTGSRFGFMTTDDEEGAATRTGADGSFTIQGVPDGIATLLVFADDTEEEGEEEEERRLLALHRVAVSRDAPPEAVRIVLEAAGVVQGRVLDADGRPLPAGETVVLLATDAAMMMATPRHVETGADGSFLFEHVRSGDYHLMHYRETAGDGGRRRIAPTLMKVGVRPGSTNVVTLTTAGGGAMTLQGTIARGGRPVAGGRLRLLPLPGDGKNNPASMAEMMMGAAGMVEATVAGDGTFAVEGIAPGEWVLRVEKEEDDEEGQVRTRRVTVTPGQQRLDVDLQGATLSGTLSNADGTPCGGAQMHAFPADTGPSLLSWFLMQRVRTDETGAFAMHDLAPGRYDLGAEADGSMQSLVRGFVIHGTNAQVSLRMSPAFELSGSVTDEKGRACEGVFVFIVGESMEATRMEQTDAEGRYSADPALPPGVYRVFACRAGYSAEGAAVQIAGAPARQDFQIVPAGELDLRLTGAGEKAGGRVARLFDAEGREVPRLREEVVAMVPMAAPCVLRPTDAAGCATVRGLRPGRYRVKIDGIGAEADVEIKALATSRVSLAAE